MADNKKHHDLITRGEKNKTLPGVLTFITLRLANIPLQRALLEPSASGLGTSILTSLGIRTITTHTSTALPSSLLVPIAKLTSTALPSWSAPLTSLTPTGGLLLLMSAGAAAKQIYWLSLSQDSFPVPAATAVSFFNTFMSTTNALLYLALGTTSLLSQPQTSLTLPGGTQLAVPVSTLVGTALYIAGIAIEALSERQRAAFKARPENEGKVCKVGMWRWARHVNYFGFTLWAGGYAMVASGWVAGCLVALVHGWDFSQRAIGVLDTYCGEKYKGQWDAFKREVPYRLVPGIY